MSRWAVEGELRLVLLVALMASETAVTLALRDSDWTIFFAMGLAVGVLGLVREALLRISNQAQDFWVAMLAPLSLGVLTMALGHVGIGAAAALALGCSLPLTLRFALQVATNA